VVSSTKHIGLAVGEELDLHARLLDDLDDDVDRTSSRLRRAQKIAKMVYEKTSDCKLIMFGVLLVVVLVLLLVLIMKHF
jgi:SYP5 family syntaxin